MCLYKEIILVRLRSSVRFILFRPEPINGNPCQKSQNHGITFSNSPEVFSVSNYLSFLYFMFRYKPKPELISLDIDNVLSLIGRKEVQEQYMRMLEMFKKEISSKDRVIILRSHPFYQIGPVRVMLVCYCNILFLSGFRTL